MSQPKRSWRTKLYETIYEANTVAGKTFDIALLICILASILVVMLDSIDSYHREFGHVFYVLEWIFTLLFSIEYILRILAIKKPARYIFSFLGMIDLLAIIPTYLSVLFAGTQSLMVLRALRLLRIFRIFKLSHFLS